MDTASAGFALRPSIAALGAPPTILNAIKADPGAAGSALSIALFIAVIGPVVSGNLHRRNAQLVVEIRIAVPGVFLCPHKVAQTNGRLLVAKALAFA